MKFYLFKIFMFGMVSLWIGCNSIDRPHTLSNESVDKESLLDSARQLVSDDKMDEAIELVEKYAASFPEDLEIQICLAALQLENFQPEKAEKCVRKALQEKPDDSRANLLMGYCLQDMKKENDAVVYFQRTLDNSVAAEEIISAHLGLASIYEKQGKQQEAESHYEAVVSANPQMREVIRQVQKELLWERSVLTEEEGIGRLANDKKRRELIHSELEKLEKQ